jgi:hypothetical protein
VHVEVAVSDRLAVIAIGTATSLSVWRLGRQTERLAHTDLPGGAGDVGRDDVGRVPVQAAAPHVCSRRSSGADLSHIYEARRRSRPWVRPSLIVATASTPEHSSYMGLIIEFRYDSGDE